MAEVKKDCFGYDKVRKNACRALTSLYCANEECKFYKTDKQLAEERRLVYERYKAEKRI